MARTLLALAAICALAFAALAGAETLRGTEGPDRLQGGAGADVLRGRGGDDVLAGRAGRDLLAGGPGADRCITDASDRDPRGCEEVVGPAGPMVVTETIGTDRCLVLRRAEMCYFVVAGHGADGDSGSLAGEGGVSPAGDVGVNRGRWSATGTYACDGDGAIVVAITGESARTQVDCPGSAGMAR